MKIASLLKRKSETHQPSMEGIGSQIYQLTVSQLSGLNAEDLMIDGAPAALVLGFASPDVDLNKTASLLKQKGAGKLLMTSTAGE